jgi:hypothetical protein
MTIRSEHDPEALSDIGRYRTYAWKPHLPGADARLNPAVGQLVVHAANEALEAKGYRRSATDTSDFIIDWHATIEAKQQVSAIDLAPRAGTLGDRLPGGGPAMRQTITTTREFNEGTLVLDIADGRTGHHVWRGWAQAEVQASVDPGERETRIRTAVRKILDEFPPKR